METNPKLPARADYRYLILVGVGGLMVASSAWIRYARGAAGLQENAAALMAAVVLLGVGGGMVLLGLLESYLEFKKRRRIRTVLTAQRELAALLARGTPPTDAEMDAVLEKMRP
jgi:hypothetical protein